MNVYQIFFIILMILCFANGFVFTSKGAIITEKVKLVVALLSVNSVVVLLISSVFEKSVVMAVAAVISYFLFSGAGKTFTLIVMGKSKQIGPFSWIMTILAIVAIYCLVFGRVVYI